MWSSFVIQSPLPPDAVLERIRSALTDARPRLFSRDPTTFHGRVDAAEFRIVRNAGRWEQGSYIVLTGRVVADGNGSAVHVSSRPAGAFLVGGIVLAVGLVAFLVSGPREAAWAFALFSVFIGLFYCLAVFIACTIEERECERVLTRIVAGDAAGPKK